MLCVGVFVCLFGSVSGCLCGWLFVRSAVCVYVCLFVCVVVCLFV